MSVNRFLNILLLSFSPLVLLLSCANGADKEQLSLETNTIRLVISENRIVSLYDKIRDVEHASIGQDSAGGLFNIELVKGTQIHKHVSVFDMEGKHVKKTQNSLEMEFASAELNVKVSIELSHHKGESVWSIQVKPKDSTFALGGVDFPVFQTLINDKSGVPKKCLYPRTDGWLWSMDKTKRASGSYPAWMFAQMMGCLGADNGFLLWTDDPDAHVKVFEYVSRNETAKFLVKHLMPYEHGKMWEPDYNTRISFCDGDWINAAEIYRNWAVNQPFCKTRFAQRRDLPELLHHPPLFIISKLDDEDLETLPERLSAWSKRLNVPVVYRPFFWEKHNGWVGIDYFPPSIGEDAFKKLAKRLSDLGILLAPDVSAFRWTVKLNLFSDKPDWLKKVKPYTEETNQELMDFFINNNGPEVCERTHEGELTEYWGPYGHRICRGTDFGSNFLQNTAKELFNLGASVFHDDQDIGPFPDGVSGCFNPNHGHPVPCGPWSTEITKKAYRDIKSEAKKRGISNFFLTKEYCSEVLNMEYDLHLSRGPNLSGNNKGKVPLSEYLYHEFVPVGLNHNSVINSGGLVNGIITGKIPGIGGPDSVSGVPGWGVVPWPEDASPSVMKLLDDYYMSMTGYAKDFLLYGKWIKPLVTKIKGCQISTWQDSRNNIGVFAINSQTSEQVLEVPVPEGGPWNVSFYIGSELKKTAVLNQDETIKWKVKPERLTTIVFKSVK